ncbi:MAG: GNAT family N-acetyltransferase [Chloracidobacterium sp.]|nr:GNAT family N-acetyltransferase [Chloracidobacterium sp.]MCO5332481.1 GNAT family N-acetyltransferase [Pyrinomonadaceae bacterium]
MEKVQISLINAESGDTIDDARMIFREYERSLGIDLCFQDFENEMASLPGKYAPPDGRLILAYKGGEVLGCIAMRKIGDGVCEMKRLYVRENARGTGLGRMLVEKIIAEARLAGYKRMLLDTFPQKMEAAVALYRSYGFEETEPYYKNPYPNVLFMAKKL